MTAHPLRNLIVYFIGQTGTCGRFGSTQLETFFLIFFSTIIVPAIACFEEVLTQTFIFIYEECSNLKTATFKFK